MMQVTRGIVVASTVIAAFVELYLAEAARPLFWIAAGGFVALLVFGARIRSHALRIVMPAMYLAPAILLAAQMGGDFSKDIVWLLPLVGLCLSGPRAFEWSLPARWQWPLITWSMIVAIAWPIVFFREADFALWIMPLPRVSNTSIGVGPWEVDRNVAYFALCHNAGILFVDALCRWFHGRHAELRREVLMPLAIAAAVACLVAFYQGFVDLSFLNSNFWTYMIRASGTLADPNKLGAVVSFWTAGTVVLARRMPQPRSLIVTVAALAIGIGASWLCGSRTGLAAVTVSVAIAAFEALRHWRANRSGQSLDIRRVAAVAITGIVITAGMVAILNRASTHTIKARGALFYLPFYGDKTIAESLNEVLWERNGYGPAAMAMIREYPLDGVGPGIFHSQYHDFGRIAGYDITATDNAQMWIRHQLAELGIAGSIPLLVWCWVMLQLMFRRSTTGDALSAALVRGVLVGFFIASTFGMPAQSIAIVLTFWIFAFWLLQEKGIGDQETGIGDQGMGIRDRGSAGQRWSRPAVIAAAVIVGLHAGATTVDAYGSLRPRERAQRFNWYYRYGYLINDADGYDREPDPGGNPIMRRWTMKKSLAVIPVKGKVLKFVAWVDHPDVDTKPVHLRVWADSKLVYEGDMRRTPLFMDIPVTPGRTHLILETEIDRTWRPSEHGNSRDTRELGLSIRDWVWE